MTVVEKIQKRITILFNVCADADNFNAQSLNAREIALRLDPRRFESTLFYEREPDSRFLQRVGVHLVRRPRRLRTIRILAEMLRRHDIIFYIDLSPSSYFYLHLPKLARRNTTTIASAEGVSDGNVPNTVNMFARYVYPHSDVLTAITEFVSSHVEARLKVKPELVVPVGVDISVFAPPKQERGHRPLTVLFVGHLIERKGPHLVLQAARQFPEVQFRLVGAARGDFAKTLHRIVTEWRLENVSFDMPVPPPQLAEIMRRSDVFLLPSRVEGLPKVTLEAAATGLPCVVFDDYQTPSVVEGVTGFQVRTFEEMSNRLHRLIEDQDLRSKMGASASDHAKQFDWDVVAKRWEQVFVKLSVSNAG